MLESPRWLIKKGRYQDSFKVFCRIRNTDMLAARDLYYAHRQILEEKDAFGGKTLARRMWELVSVPRLRRATVASSWIVISQQFSGINIMAFYSSTIFAAANYSTRDCLLASMGFGLVMFIFAFPAVYMVDTFGRRNLLLVTFPNMAWCLLAAGFSFLIDKNSSARVPLIAFFIYLFTAMYGPGKLIIHSPICQKLTVQASDHCLLSISPKHFHCRIERLAPPSPSASITRLAVL